MEQRNYRSILRTGEKMPNNIQIATCQGQSATAHKEPRTDILWALRDAGGLALRLRLRIVCNSLVGGEAGAIVSSPETHVPSESESSASGMVSRRVVKCWFKSSRPGESGSSFTDCEGEAKVTVGVDLGEAERCRGR